MKKFKTLNNSSTSVCLRRQKNFDEVSCRRKFLDNNLSTKCLSTKICRPTTYLPFTQRHQLYSIGLKNLHDYDIQKYLIVNGKEIQIKSTEDIIVLHSDSNYQIKLKLQAETTISYYGFPISYNVTKI